MAIKGKKKSQSRGSQARKRPASAPRPALVTRQHVPWYRTSGGRVAVAIGIVLAVSAVGGIFVIAGSDAGLDARRQRLNSYTGQVRELRAQITIPASQMASVAMSPQSKGFDEIGADSREWTQVLSGAQASASALRAPAGITAALFSNAVESYGSAAQMFALAATLEDDAQIQALGLAAAERERALRLWSEGLSALEAARSDAEMEPSGLQPPATPNPAPLPPAPPASSGGGGNNGGGNNDGGGQQGGGNKGGGGKN